VGARKGIVSAKLQASKKRRLNSGKKLNAKMDQILE